MARPSTRPVQIHGPGSKLLVLVVLLVASVILVLAVGVPSTSGLRTQVDRWGPAAPVAFVLLYAAATLVPLPKNVFSAVGGALFGLWWGTLLVYVAAMLGAAIAFVLGRGLGRPSVERITGGRVAKVDQLLRSRGLLAVVALRLVPVLPFTAVNYAAGLTGVRRRDYILGTAVGIVPGTVAYVMLGAASSRPGSVSFLFAAGFLAVLSVAGVMFGLLRRHRARSESP